MTSKYIFIFLKYVFLLLIMFVYLVLSADTYFYPGFSEKYFLLKSQSFSLFSLISFYLLIAVLFLKGKRIYFSTLQFFVLLTVNVGIVLIFLILYSLEAARYSNYTFSNFHLHLDALSNLALFAIQMCAIALLLKFSDIHQLVFEKIYFVKKMSIFEKVIIIFLHLLIIIIFTNSIFSILKNISQNYSYVLLHPFETYEKKQQTLALVSYFHFVRDNTEPNARILIPPKMSPWLTSGNAGYIRYFLYPREIVSGKLQDNDHTDIDYILIARGNWMPTESDYGWPKETIYASKIWYFNVENETIEETDLPTYIPENNDNLNKWGLIKL